MCGFDFCQVYGPLGEGFAECHHTGPVSELEAGHRIRLAELAVLCANCHRMIHRSHPMLTVGELRAVVESRRGGWGLWLTGSMYPVGLSANGKDESSLGGKEAPG